MAIKVPVEGSASHGLWRYIAIGLSAATGGTLLKWIQSVDQINVFITALLYLLVMLIPAAVTYFLLAKEQEKKLNDVINFVAIGRQKLTDLQRIFEVEKCYYANERLLNVERRVIEETGSSMQEVAELVSAFGEDTAHVRLKERFRVHAKSILTFDRAFKIEVEQNFKSIAKIENEFLQMPHAEREERIFSDGRDRAKRLSERHELDQVVEKIRSLTDRSTEMTRLASDTHDGVMKALESGQPEDAHVGN